MLTKIANQYLTVRYILILPVLSIVLIQLLLIYKIFEKIILIFVNELDASISVMVHHALGIADVCLVIILLVNIAHHILFEYILTPQNIESMPQWANEMALAHDARKLKSSIVITIGAIFLIHILGEITEVNLAEKLQHIDDSMAVWIILALFSLMSISIIIASVAVWVAHKK